jgi:hypothetical protein
MGTSFCSQHIRIRCKKCLSAILILHGRGFLLHIFKHIFFNIFYPFFMSRLLVLFNIFYIFFSSVLSLFI